MLLYIGVITAVFHAAGKTPVVKDFWNIIYNGNAITDARWHNILPDIPSIPATEFVVDR